MTIKVIDVGVSMSLGDREDQQDRYISYPPQKLKSRKELAIFGVFDGHGGTSAVSYIHSHLITHLEELLSSTSSGAQPSTPDAYKAAIQSALIAVDREVSVENLSGGSTVALALIDTAQSILITADLGDSHIVLGTQTPHSGSITSLSKKDGWNIDVLSEEHSPDRPAEKKRIEDAGGQVTYTTGIPRIGGVAMSRALGDTEYKRPRVNRLAGHDLSGLAGVETGVKEGRTVTSDLVSNEAHFTSHAISSQTVIMLASDGVGDASEAEEDARAVVEMWDDGSSLKEIAKQVTKSAEKVEDADNCTVLLVVLDQKRDRPRKDSGSVNGEGSEFLMDRRRRWSGGSVRRNSRRSSSMSSLRDSIKDLLKSSS